MIDQDTRDKIDKRLANAQQGYDTGTIARDYCKHVALLLKECNELMARLVDMSKRCESAEKQVTFVLDQDQMKGLTETAEQVVADNTRLAAQLQVAEERADLWKHDCEAAQVRVRELEQHLQTALTAPSNDELAGQALAAEEPAPGFQFVPIPTSSAVQMPEPIISQLDGDSDTTEAGGDPLKHWKE